MGQFLARELELPGCFLDHSAYTRREKFWFNAYFQGHYFIVHFNLRDDKIIWSSVNFCFWEKYGQIFIYNVDLLKPNLKIMTKQMWDHFLHFK